MSQDDEFAKAPAAWDEAAWAVGKWLGEQERIDALMERAPPLTAVERARFQQLVFGAVRHAGRIHSALEGTTGRPPRFVVRGVLYLVGAELVEGGPGAISAGLGARVVHHAVERTKLLASPAEARLVNAVGRKLAARIAGWEAPPADAPDAALADYYSHPAWLVRRWRAAFGTEATLALLQWNQTPGKVYARWRAEASPVPAWLKPTPWPGYFEVSSGHWPDVEGALRTGQLYVQDPGARLAVDLFEPTPGEAWLDACAAPGGKSLSIADRAGRGRLVATDADRERLPRLEENLSKAGGGIRVEVAALDLLSQPEDALAEAGLPASYPAVLVDAPCSNTGIARHRPDVKWRLREGDFRRHGRQQLALLQGAARLVAAGGRLVYSTCSIDPEENEAVAGEFLRRNPEFSLDASIVSRPWESGHDGAGVFRFRRRR